MTNSKSLGNQYERDVAKKISKWLTGSEDEIVVWRNVHSGSIGTVKKKKGESGKNVDGDFQCLDSQYESFFNLFYIDSKSLTKINLFMINPANQKSNKLLNEWKKVVDDAESSNKEPMMWVKIRDDRKIPEFIMMTNKFLINFDNFMECIFKDNKYSCIIFLQDEFLKTFDYKDLIKLVCIKDNFLKELKK